MRRFLQSAFAALLLAALTLSVGAEELKIGIGTVCAGSLNLRSEASTESGIVASAPNGDKVLIYEQLHNNWYLVEYNLQKGYMHGDYLEFDPIKNVELGDAMAKDSSANVRSLPSTDGDVVATMPLGDTAWIIGFNMGWYKVQYDGVTGYVRSDLLSLCGTPPCNGGSRMKQIVDFAKDLLGVPYAWGGTSPKSGFDCSGYTRYIAKQFSVSLERTAASQMLNGTKVSYENLKTGDLVFFGGTHSHAAISHVGIYLGDGTFIHAANGGVKITAMNDAYYAPRYAGARRIF